MGWGSIGPNGQAERRAKGLPTVKTPTSTNSRQKGSTSPAPTAALFAPSSRSSQQTGFHQGHTFADRNDPDNAKKAIRADDITMGDALSKAGYTTGYWGKWGYGGSKEQEDCKLSTSRPCPLPMATNTSSQNFTTSAPTPFTSPPSGIPLHQKAAKAAFI